MPELGRIFYTHPKPSSFVRKDIAILESQYFVNKFPFYSNSKYALPLLFLQQFFALLFALRKTDIFITQFAGYGSFLPSFFAKIFKKPSLIITGGTDCVSFPHIRYGNFSKRILGFFTRKSFQWTKAISSVHESLQWQDYSYDDNAPSQQGYMRWTGVDRAKDKVVYNGFELDIFYVDAASQRNSKGFLTVVANPKTRFAQQLKGLDMFISLALALPDSQFTVVGVPDGVTLPGLPANVFLAPFASPEQLREIMNQHRYYVQLSISEGFPNALCEAMACGCIPIVSHVASMPFIVADKGLVIKKRNVEELVSAVTRFMESELPHPQEVSDMIYGRFPLAKRSSELLEWVRALQQPAKP